MGPEALAHVVQPLVSMFRAADHPALLVGLDGADDAAVYRLTDDIAIVVTTDFFTPVVDDAFAYGAIAAANAMSDVFAMGGEVLLALNLVAFPDDLPPEQVSAIIRGGAERVRAAGGVVAGGHSITDPEPKFGLAVVGRIDPRRILRKGGALVGDVLVLTKPLGTGLITTALKGEAAAPSEIVAAIRSMSALNRAAGAAAAVAHAHAATDITGFGLIGHGLEMADAGGVALRIERERLPLLPGALEHAVLGHSPGGTHRNAEAFGGRVRGALPDGWAALLHDPQTSGGLLVALAPADVAPFVAALDTAATEADRPPSTGAAADGGDAVGRATIIGRVVEGSGVEIV